MKTGVSTACLYPLEPERSLDLLLQLGYRRFEVFPNCMEELSPAYLRDLKGRADAYGAEFVSLHPFTSAMESSLLFGDYPRRTREAFDFYRRYMAATGSSPTRATGSALGSCTASAMRRGPSPPRRTCGSTGGLRPPSSPGCASIWGRTAPLCWT